MKNKKGSSVIDPSRMGFIWGKTLEIREVVERFHDAKRFFSSNDILDLFSKRNILMGKKVDDFILFWWFVMSQKTDFSNAIWIYENLQEVGAFFWVLWRSLILRWIETVFISFS